MKRFYLSRALLAWLVAIGSLGMLVALPILFEGSYWQTLAFITFLFVSLSVSWNIAGGYAGQVSFGHSTFLGLGAFTTAVITLRTGLPAPLTIPVAGLLAMVYGFF